MSQEESKARRREELVKAYLNDTITKTFQGISELDEEAANTVLKESCKACVNSWISWFKHNYGYDFDKPDLDAFVAAQNKSQNHFSEGHASTTRQGNIIYDVQTPGRWGCPLVRNHKVVKPFPNLCLCAKNAFKMFFEYGLKRPVKVDLVETCLMGGKTCTLKIELL